MTTAIPSILLVMGLILATGSIIDTLHKHKINRTLLFLCGITFVGSLFMLSKNSSDNLTAIFCGATCLITIIPLLVGWYFQKPSYELASEEPAKSTESFLAPEPKDRSLEHLIHKRAIAIPQELLENPDSGGTQSKKSVPEFTEAHS